MDNPFLPSTNIHGNSFLRYGRAHRVLKFWATSALAPQLAGVLKLEV